MGQIIGVAAKPKRCNANKLSQVPTPAFGELILVSSDNSMTSDGQGNFDSYIEGNGQDAATALPLQPLADIPIYSNTPYNYTRGYKLDENGNLVADENYGVSDFIPCTNNDIITSYYGNADTVASTVLYNSSKTKINYYRNNAYPLRTAKIVTANTAYARISFNLNYAEAGACVNGVMVFKPEGGRINIVEHFTSKDAEIESTIQNSSIIEDTPYNCIVGYKLDEQGQLIADSAYGVSDFIACDNGDVITSIHGAVDTVASMVFLDANKRFYKYYRNNTSPSRTATADSTTKYFRVSFNLNYSGAGAIVNGERVFTLTGGKKTVKDAITVIQPQIDDISAKMQPLQNALTNKLFLGTLVQKGLTQNGLSDSTQRVSMQSCCAIPSAGATLQFTLPEHYFIGIRSGDKAQSLSYNDYWYKAGETYTFRNDVHYFRLSFAYSLIDPPTSSSYANITVATVQGLIDNGDIAIYEPNELSLFERNSENEKYAKAIMRPFVNGASNNSSLYKLPIFLHTSDVHGDAKRFENFMEYADYLEVDAALISGDMVAYNMSNSKVFIDDIASLHSTADLQCLGNHDCSDATIQEEGEMLASCIQRNSCVVNSNEQYPTYYYKDITEKNIRVIALNLYSVQGTGVTWRFSQAQCEWFITTLASTPANYGVIVMMHSPEGIPPIDEQYGKFRQEILNYTDTGALSAKPIANIIDAFIGKESRTITYTSHSTDISVSADFTSVNSGVEFIAYVNGHLHTDTIGFMPNTTHMQLVLNVCCCIGIYGTTYQYLANNSDLPRGGIGATQDSFNLYAIDRDNGMVRVAKIGSNTTDDMQMRDWMIIPYKQ